ncbi:MAG: hypothetical protein PVI41_02800 [Roseobacter sp.]|jgi:hypothetical protein
MTTGLGGRNGGTRCISAVLFTDILCDAGLKAFGQFEFSNWSFQTSNVATLSQAHAKAGICPFLANAAFGAVLDFDPLHRRQPAQRPSCTMLRTA